MISAPRVLQGWQTTTYLCRLTWEFEALWFPRQKADWSFHFQDCGTYIFCFGKMIYINKHRFLRIFETEIKSEEEKS